jgi:hypothetical protein
MREIVPPPSQNTAAVCNEITFLILYYISSRQITILKVTDAFTQVLNIFYLTVSFKFLNLASRYTVWYCVELLTEGRPFIIEIIKGNWLHFYAFFA